MGIYTILIVDDEANQRLLMTHALASLRVQCRVLPVASAEEALRMADSGQISLLITDYQMPTMSGLDLVTELRQRSHHLPVIMISAYRLDDIDPTDELRISHFLVKPFRLDSLRHLATSVLIG